MITVTEALDQLFALVSPLDHEIIPLSEAGGRVLAQNAVARRDQPPFDGSAMDGYAVCEADAVPGTVLQVIGEAAAGHRFEGQLKQGQAVRIFTGAPVPKGADRVVIQEDVARTGDQITLGDRLDEKTHIRPSGSDFKVGDTLKAPRRLSPSDVALLASMNIAEVAVARKPRVALLSTGDELVMPGESPSPDQIIASNTFGLKALLDALGAEPRVLPIARDTRSSLRMGFELAEGADLIVTIGGASVGDHDLVGDVAAELGMNRAFYKVAMRPGKPLMAGQMGDTVMLGLPGNPVSAMVCGHIFMAPMIRVMQGLPAVPAPRGTAQLGIDLPKGGPREHYMRASLNDGEIIPESRQDSSLLSLLAHADALMVRPADDGPRQKGDLVDFIAL